MPIYIKLSEEIRVRVVLHICGDTTPLIDAITESGFSAFSFEGPTVNVKQVREIIGNIMVLFGNIPTVDVLMNGTVEDVKRAAIKAIEEGIDSVTPACLTLQPPHDNALAISETEREYNKSKGFSQS